MAGPLRLKVCDRVEMITPTDAGRPAPRFATHVNRCGQAVGETPKAFLAGTLAAGRPDAEARVGTGRGEACR